jgi:hypothetical protein
LLPTNFSRDSGVLATDPLIAPCYQSCYQFLQKPARSTVNQGPPKWTISLNHKEQHERRRNVNQTHNPKVGGSNPPPATNLLSTGWQATDRIFQGCEHEDRSHGA